MNLIALVLGLILERSLTRLLHLRELRWFDRYFDIGFGWLDRLGPLAAPPAAVLLALVPSLPVFLVAVYFSDRLFGIPYLAFAALVLLFSLGPRDLGREVEEYCAALEAGDVERSRRLAKELLEADAPPGGPVREHALEEAVFVQANNRLFGVIFWFMILGPVGAWSFRVVDLMRRRARFAAGRNLEAGQPVGNYLQAARSVHWLVAWLPSRLLAIGYALAGSFEDAVADWRSYYQECSSHFFDVNEEVVACVGKGAMARASGAQGEQESQRMRAALRLVRRTFFIWLTAIAVMTLFGWRL